MTMNFDDLVEVEATKPSRGKGKAKPEPGVSQEMTQLLQLVSNLQAQVEMLKTQPQNITVAAPAPVVQDVAMVRAMQNQQVQQRYRGFNNHMVNAERVKIRIPKAYNRFFGNFVVSGINGNTVSVPIDGREHEVSVYHYDDILNKMARVDELYARQGSEVIQQDRPGTI